MQRTWPSPPSLLQLIYDVDVDVFRYFFVCHLLLPAYSQESSEIPSLKTLNQLSIISLVIQGSDMYSSTEQMLDMYMFSLVLVIVGPVINLGNI